MGKLQILAKYISHCKSKYLVVIILFNLMNHSQLASNLILSCVAIAIKFRLCDKFQNRKLQKIISNSKPKLNPIKLIFFQIQDLFIYFLHVNSNSA